MGARLVYYVYGEWKSSSVVYDLYDNILVTSSKSMVCIGDRTRFEHHLVDIKNKCSFFKLFKASLFKVDASPWSPVEEYAMKPTAVADEMFPEGAGTYVDAEEGGGSVGLLMDLSAVNERAVHDGFFNDFEDLFDDEDIA